MGHRAVAAQRPTLMGRIEITVGPVIAGLLGLEATTLSIAADDGKPRSLRDVLEELEQGASGALLEPRTRLLHRYVHVRVNRRGLSDLAHPLHAEDKVRVDMRMIEGG